ncbi:ribosome recycling factor [Natronospirillum operosum]|uniref:Ribosome-recycling factor n=1 Tax=Natronospirillum operosum TaxID=2759953 RepID=A0A4Z0WI89_9GAMM|nr:ribosome recycling factor [Natronospirillum operosum]TGG95123.1 ribosome recycling factor [Natronospirillum operosum]
MIEDIKKDAEESMRNAVAALEQAFKKIRTGRAHPSILDGVLVDYYGAETPLNQVANISVEDGRTLSIVPWEPSMVPAVEKAIMKSDLGLNPSTAGNNIRVAMPMLTEETRKEFVRQARHEAENGRISVRNARRDANSMIKDLLRDKEITEDDARSGEDQIQKLTDKYIAEVDAHLEVKEADLLKV